MSKSIHIKRGLDLKLQGAVPGNAVLDCPATQAAVEPSDFPGFVPKLAVKEGDTVSAGSPLMFDKNHSDICLTSPLAGKVTQVLRGERRRIVRVVVQAGDESFADFDTSAAKNDAAALKTLICRSGLWAMARQLPYDIVPDPQAKIRDIFVTAFDSAPLAPDFSLLLEDKSCELQAGADALCRLTDGKVYYSTRPGYRVPVPDGVEHMEVYGPHPAGLPSVQAANIAPVSKGETVLLLDAVTVARLGHLLLTGHMCWDTVAVICGSEVASPHYVRTCAGAAIAAVVRGNIRDDRRHHRIISGNVLTGVNAGHDGFLHFPYNQVTVIPEGDDVDEFMGWASLSPEKMSVNRSFLSSLLPGKKFAPDARLLGGRRAMIMSEQYDKVFPMDILPEYLVKAIIARDIDKMEQLGIYEVTPADFALCEYVDPSKLELQKIVREGLDYLRKELE